MYFKTTVIRQGATDIRQTYNQRNRTESPEISWTDLWLTDPQKGTETIQWGKMVLR